MAYTQTDIDNLQKVIASGVLRVRFEDGRERTYQSLADMRSALREIKAEVAGAANGNGIRRNTVAGF